MIFTRTGNFIVDILGSSSSGYKGKREMVTNSMTYKVKSGRSASHSSVLFLPQCYLSIINFETFDFDKISCTDQLLTPGGDSITTVT